MTSKLVVNNIASDAGISSVTLNSNIAGEDSTQNISGINSVTANAFYGDGSNLTGAGPSLANGADNRVVTASSATALNGEANLTYDGSTLSSAGHINCTSGRFQRGTATVQDGDAIAGGININGTDMDASVIMSVFGNDGDFTRISGSKSRNASVGSHTIVQNNDVLLSLKGFGSDGNNFEEAAQIEMQVDGSPGNDDMPGRILFKTTADGASSPTERLRIDSSGHTLPGANGTQDLGSSTKRWRDVYTSDLDLSNESRGGNEVDGTWGAYTIQEGENDLFLINRRNGKKYKFNLTEVS